MTEKQLIGQLKQLKNIQPKEDWVIFNKERLFKEGQERGIIVALASFIKELQKGEKFVFQHKLAFSSVLMVAIFIGLFGFVQSSVPGDSLFSIKKMAEEGQAVFVGSSYKPLHNLEIAGKRLDDLTKIAQSNNIEKLAPALVEYKETISNAAKTLGQAGSMQEIALEIKKLGEKEDKVRSLGIELDNNKDLDNAVTDIVEREINVLKQTQLSEENQKILADAEKDLENGNYSAALEKILVIGR